MTAVAPLPGIIASRYLPVRLIGKGGMGVVYEVVHAHTGQHLALKLLLEGGNAPTMDLQRFKREARAPARIRSQNVVQVLDADTAPELNHAPFLVMELLEGLDLEQAATQAQPSPATVVDWLGQIAPALDKAHRIGIVHRDLKPENLFLAQQDGRPPMVKILDFGIAKITDEGATATSSGQVLGTPRYMAPEQVTQSSKVSGATDLYALGLVAYRLLAGESYYRGPMMTVLAELLRGVPSAPSARHPHLGAGFDTWFLQACHRDPECRFVSATQQIEALAAAFQLPSSADGGERAPSSASVMERASSSLATHPSPSMSRHRLAKKGPLMVLAASTALITTVVAYRVLSPGEGTRASTQGPDLARSPPSAIERLDAKVLPLERSTPQAPPSAQQVVPSPLDSNVPGPSTTASGAERAAPPTPIRKPARAPRPSSSTRSKPPSAPDPYGEQK